MTEETSPPPAAAKPFRIDPALVLAIVLTIVFSWLRLAWYSDRFFPISTALPLLLCLWNRNLWMLYGMSVIFSVVAMVKIVWVMPAGLNTPAYELILIFSQLLNIWLVTGVIHGIIRARRKLALKAIRLRNLNQKLSAANADLAMSNAELAAREEEITRQNEELQSQSEELEQQAEELRQQAEEMEHQSVELQDTNHELVRKERAMQTLLNSGRWMRSDMNETLVMNGICQAAVQVLGEEIQAAATVLDRGGILTINGEFGFDPEGATQLSQSFPDTFAALVLESRQTACIEDLNARPDLKSSLPNAGPPFRTVIGSPVWHDGEPLGVLEIYSTLPRRWTEHEFRIVEWMAAQAAIALQSVRSHNELEQKRRDAETASVQKSRFLAAVSHDVRTPANAISLLAELIERSANDPARVHQVPSLAGNLWRNARSMIDLVSDVLDLTRFDAGHADLDFSEFSLSELIRSETHQALPSAEVKNLRLHCALPAGEIHLSSDRTKLKRIVSNLLSNAIKFTDSGEVRIGCTVLEDGGVCLQVEDSGIGIPADHVGRVFDEFFQMSNPERNREKGAGLGLAICKRLIEALGYEVKVTSLVGSGSTFRLMIPASSVIGRDGAGQAAESTAVESGSTTSPLHGLSILLVEDHQVAREVTAELLTAEGAAVSVAANGRDAIRLLEGGVHQVLLLDLNLPDFDGSEILRSLQSRRPPELRWVFVVTGDVRPERIAEVKSLGAHALIAKPVCIEKIRAAVGSQQDFATAG